MEVKEEMKVGTKGQVVIPKTFRKILGIVPGSRVVMELDKDSIRIEKPKADVVAIFEEIASKGPSVEVHPHEGYEESLRHRAKKMGL